MDDVDRKTRARTANRARNRALKGGASKAEADIAASRALRIFDGALLGRQRRAAMKRRAEKNRDDVRATVVARARRRGADQATAEAAGQKALSEMDAARKGRRAAKRHGAMVLLRTPDALAQIEARELWRDIELPLHERVLAVLRVRRRDVALGELRHEARAITAQLDLMRQPQVSRRLHLFAIGRIAEITSELPAIGTVPRAESRNLLARVFSRLLPARAAKAADGA